MNARKRNFATAGVLSGMCLVAVLAAGCGGGFPRQLREQIAAEKDSLQQTERKLQQSQDTVRDDLAHSPDLFKGASVATAWPARLQSARGTLGRAKNDIEQLDKLSRDSRGPDQLRQAERLLAEERALRTTALSDAESVASDANSWLDFERNLPHYLATMQHEYDEIQSVDLKPVAQVVEKAEQDWPAKKADLDGRLAALRQASEDAGTRWSATASARQEAAAGSAKGPAIATLIEANDGLQRDHTRLSHGAEDLRAAAGQLYDAWDKVLVDLEPEHHGGETVYREKLNVVKTHYVDVAAKKTEISNDTQWVDVPESTYKRVENDLGMTLAHKDAGQFDSEAENKAQPPGFAYIAPPSVGSNQYGYWSHAGGQSVWTFLPQYLIMRELLWGHSYQPIYINEYNGYQTARRAGRVYYGQTSPASPPKYGSHGTFTTERYAGSRYVQSGGYAGSAYSSNRNAASAPRREEPNVGRFNEPDSSAGKRFGGSSNGQKFGTGGSPESGSGKRFGTGGSGQRFGTPRSTPRLPGRSFGRRR
jgi:hypothetical protein